MSVISNLSRTSNKTILESAILLALALLAIIIIYAFQHVSAGASNQNHAMLLNTGNTTTHPSVSSNADTSSNNPSNSSSTKLTVNGQEIPMPQNGTVSQTVPNDGGGTSHIETTNQQSSSSSTGTATNRSSTTINVHSSSSSNSNQGGNE